ncbi:hypothetical protein LTR99_005332 [Exophiala xenobiotica]|uniref:Uncharacterized protein n=1 Tax=Vermiconidia calcicola TaxID=1690605 RepID=A0AAV9Q6T0_9PEZI|nr:hypothetical protein H2202_005396 [Exophiala xenobiotica]KAK5535910.1 hypothetical protein LTR25_005812 [Vermiconidia calcicola]KAK5548851.1 hypothetical protein LTR23_001340 [Chaetothyriales sp. CCFEE 6169]KAK5214039.1 hypothetical protein LTR41_000231 [Exophiala xenobiotica]KAK5227201.1 hypothetical protein LTR72_003191 [Exophiala xenobiotica]
MTGVASAGPTPAVVNGSQNAYDAVTQENSASSKTRPSGLRQNSASSTRTPLSSLAPNRKDSSGTSRLSNHRVEELGQSEGKLIRSGSEPDSLLDLYNQSSGNVSQQNKDGDSDIPENMYRPQENDPEGWIHRDKLAKIESEELQAAGINLATARRPGNKPARRETSRGRLSEERNAPTRGEPEDTRPQLLEEEDEQANWDFRTPEEISAEQTLSPIYSNPVLKKSGSKIPVLTSSPLPIPHERIERDTPLVRKRTISNSMSPEDGIPVLKTRMRRGSTGSAALLDEAESLSTTPVFANGTRLPTPKQSSPTKTKSKNGQPSPPGTSAGRKASGNTAARKATANAKNGATPSPNQRPGTRSGDLDRPRTAVNRPEGDPPWLATMYKPDPMLPPDQQIIPTHARRQQQAQWEGSGAVPSTYDRNFSPLAIHTGSVSKGASPILHSSPSPAPGRDGDDNDGASWPLRPVPSPSLRGPASPRPGTSGSTHGGYSTMPRVASPAIMHSPRMGNISTVPAQPNTRVQRIEHNDMDEKVKDKSCGCCIVM